jgi:hypothetical protein
MRAPRRVLSVRRPSPPVVLLDALAPEARDPAAEAGARGCSGARRTITEGDGRGGGGCRRESWLSQAEQVKRWRSSCSLSPPRLPSPRPSSSLNFARSHSFRLERRSSTSTDLCRRCRAFPRGRTAFLALPVVLFPTKWGRAFPALTVGLGAQDEADDKLSRRSSVT